jgi:hypothetical protein
MRDSLKLWLIAVTGWLMPGMGAAADFSVTSPGFYFEINGALPNPTLTLVRGKTYTFEITTSAIHPFEVLSPGVALGNDTSSGTITYTVATDAPATNNPGYRCSIHNFSGMILTVDPPLPPVIEITELTVGTNLIVRSTGTNTWTVIPEFNTNLMTTHWFALTVITNTFVGGTNETICGKPASESAYIRIRGQPQ